ncbi:hypothetical protein TVAG_387680 [Trichomonas vaginalis G3]|uniref:Uncharacterized protein n=1 Tax=Trichomonas vaginalis (strain ATCC PRA-98 / G3) TaxID=412133 RepID=A2E0Z5_TRIV3|nr:spectrin binding [Trichomonas vaginalis G3]EAY13627.1 hypothetical protein TVAG_387680 [Trichomonas vaginalis G3]KAI5529894.1 spectrin binding [Trichomonas vaginalis G3]|eukprot:XP_001325850.1 hypothetical protein [Trichomonas vaginalis G3]
MRKENKEIFDYLVQIDLDVNELNEDNQTPLVYAVKLNMNYYVTCLLKHNADTSIPDDYGCTPLLCAVQNNNVTIAKAILEAGSPTSSSKYELSPLQVAIQHQFIPLVYLLIEYGANPNLNNGETYLLQESVKTNSIDIFKCLLASGATGKGFDPSELTSDFKICYDQWICPPLDDNFDKSDAEMMEKITNNCSTTFSEINEKIKFFSEKYLNVDFDKQLITPVLNMQNGIITSFAHLIKEMQSHGEKFVRTRRKLVSYQFEALSLNEKHHIEELFGEDESKWYSLLEISNSLMHSDMKYFDPSCISKIDSEMSRFSTRKDEVFGTRKQVDQSEMIKARQILALENVTLERYNNLAVNVLSSFREFKEIVFKVLNKAIDSLNSFKQTLVDIRQTSYDIVLNNTTDENEEKQDNDSRIEEICSQQCDKIQVDITFVEWQKEQFTSLSILLERAIRMTNF